MWTGPSPSWRCHALALTGYAEAAVLFTWPLVLHLGTHVTGPPTGDTGVYLWNIWVFQHELLDHHQFRLFTSTIRVAAFCMSATQNPQEKALLGAFEATLHLRVVRLRSPRALHHGRATAGFASNYTRRLITAEPREEGSHLRAPS
jgi:hypothetical protein